MLQEAMKIHANCRLRRVYFCDRIYSEDELPKDYKLYLPIHPTSARRTPPLRPTSNHRQRLTNSRSTTSLNR
ncbi:unnamed protein product [Trichobilharzia regenti]|nr:unnamed protein product [Trichobilharzia regenti]